MPVFGGEFPSDTVEVKTRFGVLRGASEKGVVSFKGVPYAGPVDGTGRFLKAPPLQPWTGTRDALKLGPLRGNREKHILESGSRRRKRIVSF